VASVDASTIINSAPTSDRDLVPVGLDGGRLVFSTSVSFALGGIKVDDEDLVLLDRGALSLMFDGSYLGLLASADVDAVRVESGAPLDVYCSVDAPMKMGSVVFADDDIVRYNGLTHSLVRIGASMLGDESPRGDLDALWMDPSRNEYIFSLDVSIETWTGRTAADAEDLVLWANGSLLIHFDASTAGFAAPGLDLDAVDFGTAFFADDFETGDTTMWYSTTP